jgi:hypothetical protein
MGLWADAVLIHGPQFHMGCRKSGRDRLNERAYLFLNAS